MKFYRDHRTQIVDIKIGLSTLPRLLFAYIFTKDLRS